MDGLNKNAINFSYTAVVGSPKRNDNRARKVNPDEEIEKLLKNLNGFYEENPKYQPGLVQIATPALRVDFGAYFITVNELVENIIVTAIPERGAPLYVGSLQQARRGVSQGLRYKRVSASRTYYIWKEKGIFKNHLLLNNNEWLNEQKVKQAFDWLVNIFGGHSVEECGWRDFQLKGTMIKEIGYLRRYQAENGSQKMLICMINSGTILDVSASEVKLGTVEYTYQGGSSEFGRNVLRFKFINAYQIERCNNL